MIYIYMYGAQWILYHSIWQDYEISLQKWVIIKYTAKIFSSFDPYPSMHCSNFGNTFFTPHYSTILFIIRATSLLSCIYHNRHIVVVKKIMKNFEILNLCIALFPPFWSRGFGGRCIWWSGKPSLKFLACETESSHYVW